MFWFSNCPLGLSQLLSSGSSLWTGHQGLDEATVKSDLSRVIAGPIREDVRTRNSGSGREEGYLTQENRRMFIRWKVPKGHVRFRLKIYLVARHKVWKNYIREQMLISHSWDDWENYMTKERGSEAAVEVGGQSWNKLLALLSSEDLMMPPSSISNSFLQVRHCTLHK